MTDTGQEGKAASPSGSAEPAPAGPPDVSLPFPHAQRWGRAALVPILLFVPVMVFTWENLAADLYTLEFVGESLPVSDTEVVLNHARLTNMARAAIVLGVAAAALWLLWQYRAHANLAVTSVRKPRFRPVPGVASWFVPLGNLILVPLAMDDLWHSSDPHAGAAGSWRDRFNPLVWLWWASFLTALVLAARASVIALGADTAEQLMARDHAFRIVAIAGLPAAMAAAAMIGMLNSRLALAEGAWRFHGWRKWTEIRSR
jgi:hypothetical protein